MGLPRWQNNQKHLILKIHLSFLNKVRKFKKLKRFSNQFQLERKISHFLQKRILEMINIRYWIQLKTLKMSRQIAQLILMMRPVIIQTMIWNTQTKTKWCLILETTKWLKSILMRLRKIKLKLKTKMIWRIRV